MSGEETVARMEHISKSFGPVKALDDVTVTLKHDEALGLLGDNGAGKSTLIKILSGVFQPDSGEIYFEGKKVSFTSPIDARRMGIETIYQDLALINDLNVYHNVFLAKEQFRNSVGFVKFLDNKAMEKEASRFLNDLGINLTSLDMKVAWLSGGQRQSIAVARSVYFSAKLLIMDEPMAALGVVETKRVLDLIESLKKRGGVSIIIITHNIAQALATADRIVMLSRGRVIGEKNVKDTNVDEITTIISKAALG